MFSPKQYYLGVNFSTDMNILLQIQFCVSSTKSKSKVVRLLPFLSLFNENLIKPSYNWNEYSDLNIQAVLRVIQVNEYSGYKHTYM